MCLVRWRRTCGTATTACPSRARSTTASDARSRPSGASPTPPRRWAHLPVCLCIESIHCLWVDESMSVRGVIVYADIPDSWITAAHRCRVTHPHQTHPLHCVPSPWLQVLPQLSQDVVDNEHILAGLVEDGKRNAKAVRPTDRHENSPFVFGTDTPPFLLKSRCGWGASILYAPLVLVLSMK